MTTGLKRTADTMKDYQGLDFGGCKLKDWIIKVLLDLLDHVLETTFLLQIYFT